MTKYRIVALDMDGTLLKSDKTVHPDTLRDIAEATQKGIHVVYCSGRAPVEMKDYIETLSDMRYAVSMSGALVYDFKEKKKIYSCPVPKEMFKDIVEVAKVDDAMVHFLTENESIVREDQIHHMVDFNMGVYQSMFLNIARTVPDMMKEAEHYDSIPKINIYFHSKEARQAAYEKIKHLPLSFAFSEQTSLEMTAHGVTKADGLSQLASSLHVTMDQIIGVGDGDNDRSFLKVVGLSVAMGNASEEIKAICDEVTDDNDHNGTGKVIRKYCLENLE
ncbi:HAD-like domain-containing protein [Neocallimastix lanati (nom. inval.)]|jgi:hypothetical protein|uniref:Uncharacterized protein n=1 Tax=Neocallimastix californiae TaxID=1754190 RepID=A0A1Y2ASZ3_9FUNG|nr:HAD-like domain-containing protein [Neocallimastix sp. JGI-2020a]ORY25420.1 hypothetical protein LY90DRAFT_110165 [Neocallimastix californiae]|eukprot:ORY25420.1 hypothetical protein LY90DRAFT_110165 [Neocallimastix californiae]